MDFASFIQKKIHEEFETKYKDKEVDSSDEAEDGKSEGSRNASVYELESWLLALGEKKNRKKAKLKGPPAPTDV